MPPELAARARAAAHAYRLGMNGRASAEFAAVLDVLIATQAHAPVVAARLAPWLEELSAAQQRGDWLALADALEHELARVAGS